MVGFLTRHKIDRGQDREGNIQVKTESETQPEVRKNGQDNYAAKNTQVNTSGSTYDQVHVYKYEGEVARDLGGGGGEGTHTRTGQIGVIRSNARRNMRQGQDGRKGRGGRGITDRL